MEDAIFTDVPYLICFVSCDGNYQDEYFDEICKQYPEVKRAYSQMCEKYPNKHQLIGLTKQTVVRNKKTKNKYQIVLAFSKINKDNTYIDYDGLKESLWYIHDHYPMAAFYKRPVYNNFDKEDKRKINLLIDAIFCDRAVKVYQEESVCG